MHMFRDKLIVELYYADKPHLRQTKASSWPIVNVPLQRTLGLVEKHSQSRSCTLQKHAPHKFDLRSMFRGLLEDVSQEDTVCDSGPTREYARISGTMDADFYRRTRS